MNGHGCAPMGWEWAWLCSARTLCTKTGGGQCCSSHRHLDIWLMNLHCIWFWKWVTGLLRNDHPFVITAVGQAVICDLSLLSFVEMWYGVFLWALVSSLFFHVPAGLLALFTLRHHKYGRFMSVSILLMGIVGPITAGILTSMLDIKIPVKIFHMTS